MPDRCIRSQSYLRLWPIFSTERSMSSGFSAANASSSETWFSHVRRPAGRPRWRGAQPAHRPTPRTDGQREADRFGSHRVERGVSVRNATMPASRASAIHFCSVARSRMQSKRPRSILPQRRPAPARQQGPRACCPWRWPQWAPLLRRVRRRNACIVVSLLAQQAAGADIRPMRVGRVDATMAGAISATSVPSPRRRGG